MEYAPKAEDKDFDIESSPIRETYKLLGARTPLELSTLYTKADQELMKANAWEYDNPDLLVNKVKTILESVDTQTLTEDEQDWRQEILWLWYHHAISCAIKHRDQSLAQEYAAKALQLQSVDHPNQITKILELLVNDKLEEAQAWADAINEDEKDTAIHLIEYFQERNPFKED
ncbi:MAG: hypothetical protein KBB55_01640 [Candidatus Buchananbacteria bacterium]|nr:hypothetical protein [Candidatus Buchananbacteria bacterium]